jgi:hypothetical protein
MADDQNKRPLMSTRPTVRLEPGDLKPSWPVVLAMLEQLSAWGTFALRLGTLALIQECVRDLTSRDADYATVERMRELRE